MAVIISVFLVTIIATGVVSIIRKKQKKSKLNKVCIRFNGEFARELNYFNPFIPKFLKWALPSLTLDTSVVANRGFSQKSIT